MRRTELPVIMGVPHHPDYCYIGRKGKCMHWYPTKQGAYCSHLKRHSEEGDPFNLVWDQVKECTLNREDTGDE